MVYLSKKEEEPPEVVTYFRGFVLFVRNMTHFIILLLPDGIIAYAVLKCNIVKRKNCPALPAICHDCAANGTEKNRCKTENADFKQRLQQLRRKHNKKVLNRVELCRGSAREDINDNLSMLRQRSRDVIRRTVFITITIDHSD